MSHHRAVAALGSILGAVLALAACQQATSSPVHNATEWSGSGDRGDEPIVDEREWKLLHEVATRTDDSLGALAAFYEAHQAWDEYAAVRTKLAWRVGHHGVRTGSPYARIGAPRASDSAAPRTVLSRWLNRAVLPEAFAAKEMSLLDLEMSLNDALSAAAPGYETMMHVRLGDVLCARLEFAEAELHYDWALAARRQPYDVARVRARRDDVRRIRHPDADHIVGVARRAVEMPP